jgi:diaminopimelate decarboxylase
LKLLKWLFNWLSEQDIKVELINLGGGFSIKYVEGDVSFPIEDGIAEITTAIKTIAKEVNYPIPEIGIEPGRSIVGEAGITLYEVGTIKDIPRC